MVAEAWLYKIESDRAALRSRVSRSHRARDSDQAGKNIARCA
jgi:hypothetical protein